MSSYQKNFYLEIDKAADKKFCCNCQTMAIGFILVLFISLILIWQLIKMVRDKNLFIFKRAEKTMENISTSKTENNIIITENELNALISESINKNSYFPIKDSKVKINQEEIIVHGIAVKPIKFNIEIHLNIEVANKKIRIKINRVQAGNFPVPSLLFAEIESEIQKSIERKINNDMVENIQLKEERIIIELN